MNEIQMILINSAPGPLTIKAALELCERAEIIDKAAKNLPRAEKST